MVADLCKEKGQITHLSPFSNVYMLEDETLLPPLPANDDPKVQASTDITFPHKRPHFLSTNRFEPWERSTS